MTQAAPARRRIDVGGLKTLAYFLLPVVVVATCVGAWYSDAIADLFAHRTRTTDVLGSWVLDEAAFTRAATSFAAIAQEGRDRDALTASLVAHGDPYRGKVMTFSADRLTTRDAAGATTDLPGIYEGFAVASLAFHPRDGRPIAIIVDEPGKRIRLPQPLMSIPLKRSE